MDLPHFVVTNSSAKLWQQIPFGKSKQFEDMKVEKCAGIKILGSSLQYKETTKRLLGFIWYLSHLACISMSNQGFLGSGISLNRIKHLLKIRLNGQTCH